jgi:uncharacterized protein (TIGR02246 family)
MQSDEQQIRDLVKTWMSATKAGDVQTVLSLMSEDVVFLVAGHPPMIGKAAYAAAAAAQSGKQAPEFDGTSDVQEIRIFGDWAYLWTKLTVIVRPPGGAPPITRSGYTLSVLNRQNGKWLLTRDANMLATVPAR